MTRLRRKFKRPRCRGSEAVGHDPGLGPLFRPKFGHRGVAATGITGHARQGGLRLGDLILAVGTRLGDFATGSWALYQNPNRRVIALNVQPFDAGKRSLTSEWCVPAH